MAQGYGYRSDQRLRKENQDTFGVFEFDGFSLLVVCDGMGGHVGGRQASSIAVRTIHDELQAYSGGDIRSALRRGIEAANRAIYEMARKNYRLMGMGTTCVASVVVGHTAHFAHVGDSRAYLVREGQIRALTRDHTMVNLFVDAELLSPEDAATHPEAHVLSRSLGVERQVEVDLSEPLALQQGDRILLCSDGIHGVIGASGLGGVDWRNPQEGVDDTLSAVERAEGDDNATLVAFGVGIAGTSSPPTMPPDLASIEEEAKAAPMQVALQPVRRPTLVPNAGGVDEDVVPVERLDPDQELISADAMPRSAPPARKAKKSKGLDRRVLLVGGAAGALIIAAVALLFAGPSAPTPTPVQPQAELPPPVEAVAQIVAPPANDFAAGRDDSLMASAGTRGMFRARCLDCTGSFSPPASSAYLSGSGDPEVAVAFFSPEVPNAPRRVPNTTSVYDHPPPSGPEQTKAVRAARNKRCREALDTVRDAIRKSIDYASLYGAAWYCFNDTHTNTLARSRAATWEDFRPLLVHFEGTRRIPVGLFPDEDARRADQEATGDVDAEAAGEEEEGVQDTDAADADDNYPDIWNISAAGGIEYRLALFEIDADVQGFRDIMVDLLGEPTVADHLAADILLEATAAAAVARLEDPSPEALQAWARRVYVASRGMTGPVGELVRAHRPEVAGLIEALLFEATGGDEGLAAIENGYPNDAVPPVVAGAQAAGLAGQMPDLFGQQGGLDPMLQLMGGEDPFLDDPSAPDWRRRQEANSPQRNGVSRRSYRGPRASARDDLRFSGDPEDFDWEAFGYLKVWYPRRRMPRVLMPYQQGAQANAITSDGADYEGVDIYKRGQETLDDDWETPAPAIE